MTDAEGKLLLLVFIISLIIAPAISAIIKTDPVMRRVLVCLIFVTCMAIGAISILLGV